MLHTEQIITFLRNYKQQKSDMLSINKIGIFGSYARGQAKKDSDIDIVVDLDKPNLITLSGIRLDIKEHFQTNVDIVALWDNMNPRLKKRIDEEAIYV